jgi:hypothetical protein
MQVSAALRRGFDRVVTGEGGQLMAVFSALFLFIGTPAIVDGAPESRLVLGIINTAAIILSMMVAAVAFRTFTDYNPVTGLSAAMDGSLGFATAHLLVGTVVATVIIGLGFILIIPGIYLFISLLFWPVIVATADEDLMDAFRQSWSVTQEYKWQLLLLVSGIVVVAAVANLFAGIVALVTPQFLQLVLFSALNAFVVVFGIASVSDAYTQITS